MKIIVLFNGNREMNSGLYVSACNTQHSAVILKMLLLGKVHKLSQNAPFIAKIYFFLSSVPFLADHFSGLKTGKIHYKY